MFCNQLKNKIMITNYETTKKRRKKTIERDSIKFAERAERIVSTYYDISEWLDDFNAIVEKEFIESVQEHKFDDYYVYDYLLLQCMYIIKKKEGHINYVKPFMNFKRMFESIVESDKVEDKVLELKIKNESLEETLERVANWTF